MMIWLIYILWCVPGLKEYFGANPALTFESSATVVQSKISDVSVYSTEYEDAEVNDEFYDAIAADSASSSSDEDSDDGIEVDQKVGPFCAKYWNWISLSGNSSDPCWFCNCIRTER